MILDRTVGIELEGYVAEHPYDSGLIASVSKLGCDVGHDESLENTYWEEEDEWFGVEVKTAPFNDLSELFSIAEELHNKGWETSTSAGTHIHVDISDFSNADKVKLLRFGKGIERIIFLFVQNYRYENRYCKKLNPVWRSVFWNRPKHEKINWDELNGEDDVNGYLNDLWDYDEYYHHWNEKYQWLNILSSRYETAEFRLFHAMESVEELIDQAKLAYGIVRLVKNSSVEQLEFIIKELYDTDSVNETVTKFFQAIGFDGKIDIKCDRAKDYLTRKLNTNQTLPMANVI